ncbi:gamma-glutamyl-gamma-aminobutyrate hydrolase family protein [Nocardia sp. NEAU-G5]|uniref:Gamma-glutamyl-gamma-aminobutyrate hydrolase family protein n=1 Tax=Nocardia albiluteola TaxID=2842303 RepID=A0ABS6B037_9NOCA|nr:gamma-glutamyl-gamma-aminobutyrate hydrolase family protein [Nocardia albiluteola]MBU3063657.1 gamma-glutamyl-gamma-aminobutyrate hydrolase family protein [Nocardia albiluteola]
MSDAPVIGLTTYRQAADWSSWRGVEADLLPSDYARAVERAGGIPLLLPTFATARAATSAVDRLDGLLLAGGADINPARYGRPPHESVTAWYDDRDASELWLLAAAQARPLPVLGICRGMQLMAVAAGGTLVQHLPDVVGHAVHSGGDGDYSTVPVTVAPGHRISDLIGNELLVRSHHHQSVATHPGYVATARDADGVIQAMEAPGPRFAVAVQWHPETTSDCGVFKGLIEACRFTPTP